MSESTTNPTPPAPDTLTLPAGLPDAGPSDADLGAEPAGGPEPAAEPADPAAPPSGHVPLAALKEEREARRKLRAELDSYRQTMEGRFQALQQMLAQHGQPQQPPEAPPDYNTDPAAYLKWENERLKAQIAPMVQQTQQQRQLQEFTAAYSRAAASYAQETPDFSAAYQHAIGHMQAMERATGIPATAMEQEIALTALRQGRNPAQAIYEFARAAGYAGPKPAESDPIAPLARGQAAAKSAGAAGAPPAGGGVQRLASMSAEEMGRLSDAEFQKLMGG